MNRQATIMLLTLIVIGAALRFVNLNWGAPFYFHPDERNIASAVSQLHFPVGLNPHFFAYGSLPIYLIFFSGLLVNFFSICNASLVSCSVSFEQAIILSRIISATCSVLLIPLLFVIGKTLYGEKAGLVAATFTTFSVGFVQFAHFGTYEMSLSFFSALLFLLILKLRAFSPLMGALLLGAVTGVLVAIKVSSLVLIPLPLLAILMEHLKKHSRKSGHAIAMSIRDGLVVLWMSTIIFFLTNPFVVSAFGEFHNSMTYEGGVATGTLPVFYTQEFLHTTPVLYQFLKIYPFLLNPLLTILFIPCLGFFLYMLWKERKPGDLLLVLFLFTLFFSQAVLFVKWTRYLVPTLPFIYVIIIGAGSYATKRLRHSLSQNILLGIVTILLGFSAIFTLAFVKTVYLSPDTRVQAARFAETYLPKEARYLSEVYDLGITPFNTHFPHITLFNGYDLETENPEASPEKLHELLKESDYIILPSPRLSTTRLREKTTFPEGYSFYHALHEERDYRKVYETPCDMFCRFVYLGDPLSAFEDTATVFDRPVVRMYQKKLEVTEEENSI